MIKDFLKKIYINKKISYLTNIIGSPWKGKGAILMYHRVLPDEKIKEDLDLGLAVTCSNFEKQIKTLKSKYKIVSIDELINNLKEETKTDEKLFDTLLCCPDQPHATPKKCPKVSWSMVQVIKKRV